MIRPIIQAPDTRLNVVAHEIPQQAQLHHKGAIQDLVDTFNDTDLCIGLAATQIGHRWRVIVVDVSLRRNETYVMVNPVIVKKSDDLQLVRDGCMSVEFGKRFANTKRPKRITVEWDDPVDGSTKKQKFSGLIAAAIHHEIDHLDGILFVDRIMATVVQNGRI